MGTHIMGIQHDKDRAWARVRRAALIGTGVWCVGFGIAMIGLLIATGSLGTTNTAALFMIVGVIALPAMTLLAIQMDRRTLGRVSACSGPEQEFVLDRAVVSHDRHDRSVKHANHTTKVPQAEPAARVA